MMWLRRLIFRLRYPEWCIIHGQKAYCSPLSRRRDIWTCEPCERDRRERYAAEREARAARLRERGCK